MGTRNKTMVIRKNKIVINQYGQWDGYPTTSTATIVNFIKNTDTDKFNKILDNLEELKINNFNLRFAEMTMNYDKEFKDIQQFMYNNKFKTTINELIDKFGYELASSYLICTRDTGYKILDTMKELYSKCPDKKIPCYIDNYDGWDIEAKNIINLDTKELTTEWHGKKATWSFDKLPTEKQLKKFESEE